MSTNCLLSYSVVTSLAEPLCSAGHDCAEGRDDMVLHDWQPLEKLPATGT
jgi:hypothetical protein